LHFYYREATALYRLPVAGGAPEKLADLPTTLAGPTVLGPQHVFFVADTEAYRVAKTGGTPEPLGTIVNPGQISVATDGTAAYVAAYVDPNIELRRANGTVQLLTSLPAVDGVTYLNADPNHVYWFTATAAVRRVSTAGGTAEDFADSVTEQVANRFGTGLAVGADDIVWSTLYQSFPGGRVFARAKAGGERRELSRTGTPTGVSIHDGIAYVAMEGPGDHRIVALSLADGSRTVIGCVEDLGSITATSAGVFASSGDQTLLFPLN